MMKCPFCHFDNEDGALFCEQCKSDLAGVESAPHVHSAQPVIAAGIETVPLVSPVVESVVAEAVVAEAYVAEAMPIEPMTPVDSLVPLVEPTPITPEPAPEPPATPEIPVTEPAPPPVPVLPTGAEPRLLVLRGQKRNVEYPLYE